MQIIKEKILKEKGYIKFSEREIIEKLLNQKVSNRKIGKVLGRGNK